MAKNTPAFQFYPSDFLGGVIGMPDEAIGVYIKLLCALWIKGNSLPSGLSSLTISASTLPSVMEEVWPIIEDKFEIVDGMVTHPRFTKMIDLAEKNRQNGVKGGRPKVEIKNPNGNPNGNPNKTQRQSESKAKTLKNEERRMKSEELISEDWVLPDGWDRPEVRQALDDWAAMRSRIKKPISSKVSTSKIFKKFDSPDHLIAAAEECEANEWQGLKPVYGRSVASGFAKPSKGMSTYENAKIAMGMIRDE